MPEKKLAKYFIIRFIICVLLSLAVLFLHAPLVIIYLNYFIGGLLILYFIDELLIDLIYRRKKFFHNDRLYLALFELILGLTVMFGSLQTKVIYVIWATWSIIRESYEVKEIFVDFKNMTPRILSGIETVAVVTFSILLIISPVEHEALIHSYLLIAELLIMSLVPLIESFITKKKVQRREKSNSQN